MHKTSIGFDVTGFGANLNYKRAPSFSAYILKINRVNPDPAEGIDPDYIDTPSLNALVDSRVKAERSAKQMELTITAATGVPEASVRKEIDAVIGDGAAYRQQAFEKLPYQENTDFMWGMRVSAGYHYHLPLVICNVRAGLDYLWGKFKSKALYPASLAQLGWGVKTGVGLDYKLTDQATFGFEGGVRVSAFKNISNTSWFVLPYGQMVCGFSPHPDYSISAFMGYFFPTKFTINTGGGNIPSGTRCKVDGIFGGLRVARYF